MANERDDGDLCVNSYYDMPNGQVALITGCHAVDETISYRLDDDNGIHTVQVEALMAWKRRPELQDFPNSRDPVLPFDFNLIWDLKRRSSLVAFLSQDMGNAEEDAEDVRNEVRAAMSSHGIELTDDEEATIIRNMESQSLTP